MEGAGLAKRYFTGKPCKNGHICERFTSNSQCVECNKAHRRAWALKYPGRNADWNKRNPEKMREIGRRCYANNAEKRKTNARNQTARRKNSVGSHTTEDIADIYALQRGRCAYCRRQVSWKNKHIDHIIALKSGGSNNRANLQITCETCNVRKNVKHPIKFAQENGLLL